MTTSQIEALWALAVARSTFRPVVVRTTPASSLVAKGHLRYRLRYVGGNEETVTTGIIAPSGRLLAAW
jgi:hypothetical protein